MTQHHAHAMHLTRRRWLQAGSTLAASSLLNPLAQAQSSYKALVCVFLYGGNDGLNCIVPMDARHGTYQTVRKSLAVPLAALKPLDGVPFGLHPSLAKLQPIWNAGQMTAVMNVGPLVRPFVDREDYFAELARHGAVPPRLFSHSDQQRLWQAVDGLEFSRSGWGGRAMQTLAPSQLVMSLGGNAHFGQTALGGALTLPQAGNSFMIDGLQSPSSTDTNGQARKLAFEKIYGNKVQRNEMTEIFMAQQTAAIATSNVLSPVVRTKPGDLAAGSPIREAFAPLTVNNAIGNALAGQLFQVAKLIQHGQTAGANKEIYFVELGGFDTHADQSAKHNALLAEVADALSAFNTAMQSLGLGQAVTTFTESDFGRTFSVNNSQGTDHAWGNMHFVMGGAVKPRAVVGNYPTLHLGGPDDAGKQTWEHQGRWIPSTSVEQYAATLLGWWGASDAQQGQILPNLSKFAQRNLGFMA